MMAMAPDIFRKALSADSHVTEPPRCYIDYIDPKYRDRAPRIVTDADGGESFHIDGMAGKVPLAIVAAAGIDPREIRVTAPFSELHRGGWEPKARIADQDRDGILGEVIYPSVGMMLCNHSDPDYKQACMWAYNRWLQEEFCAGAPDRLFGMGQTAVRSIAEAVEDFRRFKEMGFRGVMMPGVPATQEAYHDEAFDPLWRAAVELDLPVTFHILTTRSDGQNPLATLTQNSGGKAARSFQRGIYLLSALQEIIMQFIWGRVFERHPKLKLVIVEADAGWAPHFIRRMDHTYDVHRHHMGAGDLSMKPSGFFKENVYLTFQDDLTAFQTAHLLNPRRLLWANDFPHSDSTWPKSQDILREHTKGLSEQEIGWIVRDNTAQLYNVRLQ